MVKRQKKPQKAPDRAQHLKKAKAIPKDNDMDNKLIIKTLKNSKQLIIQFPKILDRNKISKLSIPIFRNDSLYNTPGFCLADQFNQEFVKEQQSLHQWRVQSEKTIIDCKNIKLPKPSSRNSYCTICKIRFEDYKQHTELEQHLKKMRNSPYNKIIEELSEKKRGEIGRIPKKYIQNNIDDKSQSETKMYSDEFYRESRKNITNSKQTLYQLVKKECNIKSKQFLQNNYHGNQQLYNVFICC